MMLCELCHTLNDWQPAKNKFTSPVRAVFGVGEQDVPAEDFFFFSNEISIQFVFVSVCGCWVYYTDYISTTSGLQ